MKTTQQGRTAESLVAEELKKRGYKILGQNWRSKACEIDIIALKDKVAYLAEVKYRGSQSQGDGFAYVTPAKLKQMHFAGSVWAQYEGWDGDFRLMAASVDGPSGEIDIVEIE